MAAVAAAALTTTLVSTGSTVAADGNGGTATPIKHVIVVIGENHTFDNVFATYRPKDHQQVLNLLSDGIVNPDGTPGPAPARAMQQPPAATSAYSLAPTQ